MPETQTILQENLKMLFSTHLDTSRLKLPKELKMSGSTLGSIQYSKGHTTLKTLETVARLFGLETWQLFCRNLGQTRMAADAQVSGGNVGRWPFDRIKPIDFDILTQEDKNEIENQVAYKIKRLKENGVADRKK